MLRCHCIYYKNIASSGRRSRINQHEASEWPQLTCGIRPLIKYLFLCEINVQTLSARPAGCGHPPAAMTIVIICRAGSAHFMHGTLAA